MRFFPMRSPKKSKNYECWKEASQTKTLHPEKIKCKVGQIREQGLTIATLNGSFDLMHAGHLHTIYEASKQADILIVALNSDESIKGYKDPSRPIIPLNYRIEMMTAIGFVDYVTWFHELDPRAILEEIRPDIHANGSEYGHQCIEAETVKKYGGQIHIIDLVPGLSTSTIIHKIEKLCAASVS